MVIVIVQHYIRVGAPLPSVSLLGVLRCAASTRINSGGNIYYSCV